MASVMQELTEPMFRERFKTAFDINYEMTSDEFYQILTATGFDERLALLKVMETVTSAAIKDSKLLDTADSSSSVDSPNTTPTCPSGSQGTPIDLSSDSDNTEDDENNVRATCLASESKEIKFDMFQGHIYSSTSESDSDELESGNDIDSVSQKPPVNNKNMQVRSENDEQVNLGALKSAAPTTNTRWIGRLAGALYVRNTMIIDGEQGVVDNERSTAANTDDPRLKALIDLTYNVDDIRRAGWVGKEVTKNIKMEGVPIWNEKGKIIYKGARVDGVTLREFDFVVVRPDTELDKNMKVAAGIWFARISYLFKDKADECWAHVQWLHHGGDTILGETAGPKELFLTAGCDNIPLGSIASKIEVDYVGKSGVSGIQGIVEESFSKTNHYFYRFFYCEGEERFEDVSLHESSRTKNARSKSDGKPHPSNGPQCDGCEEKKKNEILKTTTIEKQGKNGEVDAIKHHGIKYAVEDFVYIVPPEQGVSIVAQITKISQGGLLAMGFTSTSKSNRCSEGLRIEAKVLDRFDALLGEYTMEVRPERGLVRDNRRLYLTNRVIKILPDKLDGKCFVQHINKISNMTKFKDLEDTFYVDMKCSVTGAVQLKDLRPLDVAELFTSNSDEYIKSEMTRRDTFHNHGYKLAAMEIFAGAGGLTAGLHQSGSTTTCWAVEHDVAAARTLKRNFPSINVYAHDANVMLKRAIDENLGNIGGWLYDLEGIILLPMPKPGEVYFLYGGPPCQDYTGCNHYKKAQSIKNSLITTYLSYVDHYRPRYFLLENVRDLIHHRLGSLQVDIHKVKGGIEMGTVKFILRALTSMGYQCQFSILQAGEHGTPQNRQRIFFWGAQQGYPMPKYPEPTTDFHTPVRAQYMVRNRRAAPHPTVTVGDAITDLPVFDWKPEKLVVIRGESATEKANRTNKRALFVPQVLIPRARNANARIGGDTQRYALEPLSEYQREMRAGAGSKSKGDPVSNHYTMSWNDETIERVIRIPMRPGANHLDLDEDQDMWCLRHKESKAPLHKFYPDRYKRLDYNEPFQTCLTTPSPAGKNGNVLHPTQYRVLSVRETARAQGFPDSFTWDSETQLPKEMYRQIGNAVPVPLGCALGKELLKVIMDKWFRDGCPSTENKWTDIDDLNIN